MGAAARIGHLLILAFLIPLPLALLLGGCRTSRGGASRHCCSPRWSRRQGWSAWRWRGPGRPGGGLRRLCHGVVGFVALHAGVAMLLLPDPRHRGGTWGCSTSPTRCRRCSARRSLAAGDAARFRRGDAGAGRADGERRAGHARRHDPALGRLRSGANHRHSATAGGRPVKRAPLSPMSRRAAAAGRHRAWRPLRARPSCHRSGATCGPSGWARPE